ncbi:hypothetical protein N182_34765 [Sinorhizobium sp. GL2]|nr:hypothetical protein N182_34765 [Sinorhizobium sp. GL2]
MGEVIGIDLGATNSCVAVIEGTTAPIIENLECRRSCWFSLPYLLAPTHRLGRRKARSMRSSLKFPMTSADEDNVENPAARLTLTLPEAGNGLITDYVR